MKLYNRFLTHFVVFAVMFGALMALPFISKAQASCRYKPVKVVVKQVQLPLQLDRNFSSRNLTATSSTPVAAGSIVLGHGGGGMQIKGSLDFVISGSPKTGYCPKIRQVNIELQVSPKIKLANSLRPGSCEYNVVYQHEQFHVAVLERTAATAAQQIPSMVNTHIRNLFSKAGRYSDNPQRLQAQMQMEFSQSLSSINNQMSSHMNSEQHKIDNPTEYARVQNSCAFRHKL